MTKKVLSLIRHICLIWLIIYLIISIFKFIQINIRINEKYGIVSKKFFVVGYTNESIVIDNILLLLDRTVFPHFNPFYSYTVPEKMSTNIVFKTSFMDRKFSVTMKDGIITRDNFYEVLLYDKKFQHLYSEWVKKQVGIDDENIDIEITCTDIRFQDIEKYETADNIFECSSGRINSIILKNAKKDASTSFKEKFMEFEKKYVERFHDINLSCAYNFTIVGNDEEVYLHYKIDEYVNEYSKECYRTRYGCEIDDELCAKVLEFLRSGESEKFEKFKAIASILKINDKNSLKLFNTINEEIDCRWPKEKDMDATKKQQEIETSFIYRFYRYFKYIKLMMEDKYATNIDQEFIEKYINGLKSNQVFLPQNYEDDIRKELYSIITSDGEYKEIEKIDFNEKSYKYIINEVLLASINELKPIHMFNLSKEIIDNYYYNYYGKIGSIKKTDINKNYSRKRMKLDEKLSNKLEYRDGYLVYEQISVTRDGYRDNDYELELLELQYKSTEGMLDSYELVGKVKSRITNSFELASGYSIYIKGTDDKWKEVYKRPERYIESSDTTVPPPEIYEKVLSKFMEYYKTDGS
jgi:hypothetical protein